MTESPKCPGATMSRKQQHSVPSREMAVKSESWHDAVLCCAVWLKHETVGSDRREAVVRFDAPPSCVD
ncbi:hypothetical protein PMIN01_04420 [Paraphaeosphaeria minitans]|uniref:Uncharacterized protein n=1 Tax=Paraphaeosphaeria minitans TaxID=565426 RepID=A0A9P6GJ78_9PLEO|nr:hypothetical protein PMIN01_04420 [Paraphaeosphaeria minitans]